MNCPFPVAGDSSARRKRAWRVFESAPFLPAAVVWLFVQTLVSVADASPGDADAAFAASANGAVYCTAVQPDGKILIGGEFTSVNGIPRNRLARLHADGTLDADFPGDLDAAVRCIATLRDGKILTGGDFSSAGGAPRTRLARLLPGGQVDDSYIPLIEGLSVDALVLQEDGSVVAGGDFTKINGSDRRCMARLKANGELDAGFNPRALGRVRTMMQQPDGKIMIGGDFVSVNNTPAPFVTRLLPSGFLDLEFAVEFNGPVLALARDRAGRLLAAGEFTKVNGLSRLHIARLYLSGGLDMGFYPAGAGAARTLVPLSDGSIIAGGVFGAIGGTSQSYLARLNEDGNADTSFSPMMNGAVYSLSWLPGGRILAGGDFSTAGGAAHGRMARLEIEARTQSLTASSASKVQWILSGAGPDASQAWLEIASGPDVWTQLGTGSRIAGGWEFSGFLLPFSGKLRAKGWHPSGAGNGSFSHMAAENEFSSLDRPPDVVSPIADMAVEENANATHIDLTKVFRDDVTPAADLTYTAVSTGGVVQIEADNQKNEAVVRYLYSIPGIAAVTVRATDSKGQWVEDSFSISVQRVHDGGPGEVDLSFNVPLETGAMALALDSEGRILAGGEFTRAGGLPSGRIERFRPDGALDGEFNAEAQAGVYSIAVQDDGTLVLGGRFSEMNGVTRNLLARVDARGHLDESFNPDISQGFGVHCLTFQPDGRIIASGEFNFVSGIIRRNIARVAGHLVDQSFNPGINGGILTAAATEDGRTVTGGLFNHFQNDVSVTRAAIVGPAGSLQRVYAGTLTNSVEAAAVQPDGKILLGGSFGTAPGAIPARNNLARFNTDGSIDESFSPEVDGIINVLLLQTDGKIIIGGRFTTVESVSRNRLARLLPDGSLDPEFNPDANGYIYGAVLQPDGKLLAGGTFDRMGGVQRDRLARLDNDPATQRLTVESATRVRWLRGGSSPETVLTTFHYSDGPGQPWRFAGQGRRIPGGWEATGLDLPATGLMRARARYAGGRGNGSSSLAETVIAFNVADIAPVTAEPIADYAVDENDPSVTIDLRAVFDDDKTPDADLVYAVVSNSNPGLAAAAADNGTDLLTLTFAADSSGMTSITVSATDALGQKRLDTFMVTVRKIQNGGPGDVDLSFRPGAFSFDSSVYTTASLPDGRLIAGGNFTSVAGVSRRRAARFLPDGSLDPGFDPDVSGIVNAAAVLTDGKTILGGFFSSAGGLSRQRLARLLPSGAADPAFTSAPDNVVTSLAIQSDGRIAAGGYFTAFGENPRGGLARLLPDGQPDLAFFDPALNGEAESIALRGDGRILAAGGFTSGKDLQSVRLALFKQDGSADTLFNASADSTVKVAMFQPDRKILIGGYFMSVNGTPRRRFARLEETGALDASFNPDVNDAVLTAALQTDGKVIIGGLFSTVGGVPRNRIARLHPDGSLDPAFNPGADGEVRSLMIQADGRVIAGGSFNSIDGIARSRLARMHNGPAGNTLATVATDRVRWQRGGTSPEAQDVTFESSPDGISWTAPVNAVRTGSGWESGSLNLPQIGKLRARARIACGGSNGSSGLIEVTAPCNLVLDAWRRRNFGAAENSSGAAPAADPDRDGITNFLEFSLGLNPLAADAGLLPAAELSGDHLQIRFTEPAGIAGVVFAAEWSADLPAVSWTPVPDTGAGPEHIFRAPRGASSRIFMRLRIEQRQF